jgi:D-amino-acid dehydrogenase
VASRAVVVGGGAIGVASASYLCDAGFDVTILERGEVGRGCSYANAGLICPGHSRALPGPGIVAEGLRHLLRRDGPFTIRPRPDAELARWLLRFRRACSPARAERASRALTSLSAVSLDLYEDLVRAGRASFGFRRGPLLNAYRSDGWRARADAFAREAEALGSTTRILERDALLELEPALATDVRGGLLIEDQGSGDCFAYVTSLVKDIETRGVHVRRDSPARRVVVRKGHAIGVAVGARDEVVDADVVVLAAGAWTAALARPLGPRLPIQPATGYSSTVPAWPGAPELPVMLDESHVVILPLGDHIRFAGTLELAGFRRTPDPIRSRAVAEAGRAALRQPPPAEAETWFGFRPLMPDDLPAIGRVPGVDGVIVAAGHGTLGFTQSPATGKLVAEIATGAEPSVPLEPFAPDRFSRG